MSDTSNPPFSKDGKPANQGSGGSGGRDFTTDFVNKGEKGPGNLLHDRPQSEAKPEVTPNEQEIPKGGKILLAEPGAASKEVGGPTDAKSPFKGLK